MIRLKKISISNFLSFGKAPTVVDLDENRHLLIKGNNLDVGTEGESLNGSGKTAILQAVIFALYGKGTDKLKPDQYVNISNKKKMVIELDFELGGDTFKIRRGRKPSFVELYKNDVSLTRDAMKNTEEDIQSTIGIPYEVFMSIYFLSPHKDSFMSMTSAEQRNYLESVLSLDVLVQRSETLKAIKKDLNMEVKLLERDYDNSTSQKEKAEAAVERLEASVRDFEKKRADAIDSLKESLEEASQIDFDAYISQIEALPSKFDIDSIKMNIKSLRNDRDKLQEDIKAHAKKKQTLVEAEEKRDSFFDDLVNQRKGIESKIAQIPSKRELEKGKDNKCKLNELRAEYSSLKLSKESAKKDMDRLADQMEKMLDELDALQEGKCPYCSQTHVDDEKIAEVTSELDEKEKEFNVMESSVADLTHQMSVREEDGLELKALIDDSIDEQDLINELRMLYSELDGACSKIDQQNPYDEQVKSLYEELNTFDPEEAQTKINDINIDIQKNIESYEKMEKQVDETYKRIESEVGTISVDELKDMKREVSSLEDKIKEEENKKNVYREELSFAKENVPEVDHIKKQLDDTKKDEEHVAYLVKLLTDPKSFVRKNIVDQYIPYVNKKINEYSELLGLMHVSEVKPDMTVEIQYMQNDVSYFNMSQGERLRVNLATAMAFSDLMSLLGKSMNIYMVDEYLDSALDAEGMMKAFNFLKSKSQNIMMISHRDELCKQVDETMTVTKKNGFSSIKVE